MITDPEATYTHISVSSKMAARPQASIGAYRQHMVEQLFSIMLSGRLDEIAQAPNAPFLKAQTDRGLFVRTEEATTLDALVATGGVERGLAALLTEVDRVARFGFTATELNREKLNLQRGLQRSVIEKDKSPSGPLADEFVRNFIQAEPIPGIVYEYGLNQRFLPEITLAEVNSRGQGLDAQSQPAGRDHRAREGPAVAAHRSEAGRGDQRGQRRTADGLRRYDQHAAAALAPPVAGSHRHHLDERSAGHHRVALVQRRPRRAQADHVQAGRDPVSGCEPGRHLARERPGLHPG